jgi:chaperonin GroES
MSWTVFPQHDRILVRRDETDTVSAGGILLPETTRQDRPQKGEVLAVGPGKPHISDVTGQMIRLKSKLQTGDVVLFTKYAGDGFKIDGEELFLVKDEDIVAILVKQ